ncbi:hypothetical protein BJ912DRAFT_1056423 [Pholiota molesta]|nr:hypothetical protein BJ912DRAFT_1056423 [Pholiota molesta]
MEAGETREWETQQHLPTAARSMATTAAHSPRCGVSIVAATPLPPPPFSAHRFHARCHIIATRRSARTWPSPLPCAPIRRGAIADGAHLMRDRRSPECTHADDDTTRLGDEATTIRGDCRRRDHRRRDNDTR